MKSKAKKKPAAAAKPSRTPPRATRGTLRAPPQRSMPQTGRSKAEEAMEQRLETLEPGSQRHVVLKTAIDFKRSWLQLASHLTNVAQKGAFKEWGYRTFEAYAQHELHLRRETAQKLVRSYDFLNAHERRTLDGAESEGEGQKVVPLPSYQALDVLAEARKNPYLSERDYRELRDQVFREDPPPSQIRKTMRERAPEPEQAREGEAPDRIRKCLALAERLYGMLLEVEDLPEKISAAMESVVGGLRKQIEE